MTEQGNKATGDWTTKSPGPESVTFESGDPVLADVESTAPEVATESDLQPRIDATFNVSETAESWDCAEDSIDVELDLRSSVVASCSEPASTPEPSQDTGYCD